MKDTSNKIKLVLLDLDCNSYWNEIRQYRDETLEVENHIHGSSGLRHCETFLDWYNKINNRHRFASDVEDSIEVESSQYLAFNNNEELVGMIDIRHRLNNYLKEIGGHIGYSIRPKFRGQGYATEMLRQAVEIAQNNLGIKEILITCSSDNKASARVIEKNGGLFDRVTLDYLDNEEIRRYYILKYN